MSNENPFNVMKCLHRLNETCKIIVANFTILFLVKPNVGRMLSMKKFLSDTKLLPRRSELFHWKQSCFSTLHAEWKQTYLVLFVPLNWRFHRGNIKRGKLNWFPPWRVGWKLIWHSAPPVSLWLFNQRQLLQATQLIRERPNPV